MARDDRERDMPAQPDTDDESRSRNEDDMVRGLGDTGDGPIESDEEFEDTDDVDEEEEDRGGGF